jgi:RNA polymerase sigma-70 factor (ECF subfamily)
MKTASDIGRLVIRATSPDDELRKRDEAFADLVARFQDAMYACAYFVLGDPALAEDAAQDAFIAAWLNLPRLREPEAFGGWLRRIVLRESTRRLRASRRSVPLETAYDVASDAPAPADEVERRETARSLLASLPEHERETAVLFYMGGHSQRDIAASLGVSVTAVKQRLHSARQRLKRREAEIMGELDNTRPSRDDTFARSVAARLRAFTDADYAGMESLVNGILPGFEEQNAEWLANRRRFAASGLTQRMYVAEDATSGEVLGYGAIEQDPADFARRVQFVVADATPARFRLHLLLPTQSLEAGVGEALLERLERDAAESGGQTLWHRLYAHETAELQRLQANGFVETSHVTEWHRDAGAPIVAPTSVAVTTLADERPMAELLAFWNAVAQDQRPPQAPFSLADIEERIGAPHIVPEGYFIARLAGSLAGVLVVRAARADAPGRRVISMHVLRSAAGQGVEQALVAWADAYAQNHGVTALETHTADGAYSIPTPYDALGFTPFVEMVVLEKTLPVPAHP